MAQDDEGFEIADFGAEGDDSGDEEEGRGNEGARYDAPSKPAPKQSQAQNQAHSQNEPQASTTAAPKHIPRESLDGETIFAVGDEDGDKWSDDEDDNEERSKLVGKNH